MRVVLDVIDKKAKLVCSDIHAFDAIRQEFSTENVAKSFARGKAQFIPARNHVITATGTFSDGIAEEIRDLCLTKQIATECVITTKLADQLTPKSNATLYSDLKFTLRDYQLEAVKLCIERGRGICVLGTGAGKTLLTASLIASFCQKKDFKCLLLVPEVALATQALSDFTQYGVPFTYSIWTGKHELDTSTNVIIANQKIVLTRHKANKWIYDVDMIVVDEVHTIKKGNKIADVLKKVKTFHRFGLTGTMPPDKIDRWNVIGMFGSVLMTKSGHELREGGYITNVEVRILNIQYKHAIAYDWEEGTKYHQELKSLHANVYRNNLIKDLCTKFNKNILILVNHIEHGEILRDVLSTISSRRVFFIQGSVEEVDRAKIRQMMEADDDLIIISISRLFSTGISVNNIHMIIFAAGGKSFVRIVQSIGRGVRKHANKNMLIIIDICDLQKYSMSHGTKRIDIYEEEKIKHSTINFVEK